MLTKSEEQEFLAKNILFAFGFSTILFVNNAHALPTLGDMINNTQKIWEALIALTTLFAYGMSVLFALLFIMQLSNLGNERTNVTPKTPIITFIISIAFFYMPELVVGMAQDFGVSRIGSSYADLSVQSLSRTSGDVEDFLGMVGGQNNELQNFSSRTLAVILTFVALVGYWAIIKGFLIIYKMGKSGQAAQDATFGKALTHIIGGFIAIYILEFAGAISNEILGK